MAKNPKVAEYIEKLSDEERENLCYAALAIGFNLGQTPPPPVRHANWAFQTLDEITDTLQMYVPAQFYLDSEDENHCNMWRQLFGEPLLNGADRDSMWGLSIGRKDEGGYINEVWTETDLTLDEALDHAREYVAARAEGATEEGLDFFREALNTNEVTEEYGFWASIEDHGVEIDVMDGRN